MRHIAEINQKGRIFKIYKINKSEINVFKDLNDKIHKTLSPELSTKLNSKKLKAHFEFGSILFLAYYKNKPVAYSFLYNRDISTKSKWKTKFLLKPKDIPRTVMLSGTGILASCRGFGLQNYFIKLREKYALEKGFNKIVTSVSPKNTASYNNLVQNGYKIINRAKNQDGYDRFYLTKEIK